MARGSKESFMMPRRIVAILALALALFCGNSVCRAADGFESVRCGSDVRKALVGRKMSNETIVVLEERHKELGLKDLGADELSDHMSLVYWRICGEEYVVFEDRDIVKDALKLPNHSKDAPEFLGSGQVNGHDLPGTIIAVLKNEEGAEKLTATAAWKIDEKRKKFVALPTEGLRCPRDGIITVDGGR